MAIGATMYHVQIALQDVDRGVYEGLDVRVARHPSESMRYLVTRLLAYCLAYEEGIALGKGLAEGDDPSITTRSLDGRLLCWIDIGSPSPERLHRAAKAAGRVMVFTHLTPEALQREARGKGVHRADTIEIVSFSPSFIDAVAAATARTCSWEVTASGGHLYVTVGSLALETEPMRATLSGEG